MIIFSLVDPDSWRGAYEWHRAFVKTNDLVFPRTIEQFEVLARREQIWCATEDGGYLGLVYFNKDRSYCTKEEAWEIGGLMVDPGQEGHGVGKTLVCLAVGYVLFEEQPLARGIRIIAHVHDANRPGPRPIFEHKLSFVKKCDVEAPGDQLPGLRVNEKGMVTGVEFWLTTPETLKQLAAWCRNWPGKLKDNRPARIVTRDDLGTWAEAFEDMASR